MVPILMPCSSAKASSSGRRAMVPSSFMISQITPLASKPAMRDRSQAASVWPARDSTPPGWAIRGKMCPGLTISSALAPLATATCTVRARSAAEMPVVTPSAASMDTVKLVPKPEPLRCDISGRSRASQRSRLIGRQIRPRAKRAMKLMCSAWQHSAAMIRSPSFSRSSSSMRMTILPWRMSSTSSSIVLSAMLANSLLEVAVFGQETFGDAGCCGFGGFVAEQQTLDITRQHVNLQVDPPPGAIVSHDGFHQGVRHDGQLELRAVDRVHRQAGAIYGDRALVGDVLGQLARRANLELHGAGIVLAGHHLADTIDVAADQMAAQAAGRRQGLFQVDRAAGLQVDETGACQCLATDIGPKAVAGQFHGGQAHAVDGDAVAELDVAQVQLAGGHINPHITALGRDRANAADGFDYSCEHAASVTRRVKRCI